MGPYEVVSALGAGGMGEVYRARDPRLARDVAIKVLPRAVSGDPERVRRFEQEARAAGSLNHPNILSIFDFGTEDGSTYMVSELLEGQTLRDRMAGGTLPLRKVTDIALQVAHGLAAAHEKGITHRDLKPENLFITRDGRVKILDFGLAKLREPEGGVTEETPTLTDAGKIFGTVGYMAPEQVRGKPADARSGIFAFGAIVYEMLTGRPAFRGDSAAEIMSAVLREDPPEITPAAPGATRIVPPAIERLVMHCLEKSPEERFQSARDLAFALEHMSAISGPVSTEGIAGLPPARSRRWRVLIPALLLCIGFLSGVAAYYWYDHARHAEPTTLRFLTYSGHDSSPAASPDGRTVAFASDRDGRSRIWLKQLPGGAEVALTDGPDNFPRFSPDGASILFARSDESRPALYRTATLGGGARKIVEDATDGDWSPDGRQVVFTRWKTRGAQASSAFGIIGVNGEDPHEVADVPNQTLLHPRWSPDGRTVAAVVSNGDAGSPQPIYLLDLPGKTVRRISTSALGQLSAVSWANSGRELLYSQTESVIGGVTGSTARIMRLTLNSAKARPVFWSPQSSLVFEILGSGRAVFDTRSPRVNLREYALHGDSAEAQYRWMTRGNSNDRQPAYNWRSGEVLFSSNRSGKLDLWELSTKTGAVRRLTDDDAEDWDPAFMPDGKRIIWSSNRGGNFEIWMANANGNAPRQLTHDGVDAENPTATPDGWVIYASGNPAKQGIWKIREDGSAAQRLVPGNQFLPDVSPDGRYAAYTTPGAAGQSQLRLVRIADGSIDPFRIALPVFNQSAVSSIGRARWMPDGRALAFIGQNEQGVNGIYLQDFVPGQDTRATMRRLAGFDPEYATESFGISSDGSRLMIASWEQLFNLMVAENVPDLKRPAP